MAPLRLHLSREMLLVGLRRARGGGGARRPAGRARQSRPAKPAVRGCPCAMQVRRAATRLPRGSRAQMPTQAPCPAGPGLPAAPPASPRRPTHVPSAPHLSSSSLSPLLARVSLRCASGCSSSPTRTRSLSAASAPCAGRALRCLHIAPLLHAPRLGLFSSRRLSFDRSRTKHVLRASRGAA
jgi:hypothetical protein